MTTPRRHRRTKGGEVKPIRIQLSRRKGWKMPENTVSVARPTIWGNPYRVGIAHSAADAVSLFRHFIAPEIAKWPELELLRGKNLACWCALDEPHCHADVLLELANIEDQTP